MESSAVVGSMGLSFARSSAVSFPAEVQKDGDGDNNGGSDHGCDGGGDELGGGRFGLGRLREDEGGDVSREGGVGGWRRGRRRGGEGWEEWGVVGGIGSGREWVFGGSGGGG